MSSIHAHPNVYSTCIHILKTKGYTLSQDQTHEEYDLWTAQKGAYDFTAYNPLELLGLVAIYEFKSPEGLPFPYWWVVKDTKEL